MGRGAFCLEWACQSSGSSGNFIHHVLSIDSNIGSSLTVLSCDTGILS